MNAFDALLQCRGNWQGTNQLILSPGKPADESSSTLIITPLLRDMFVRIDQTWAHESRAHEGSMLIGCDPKSKRFSLHWIDTFHNGRNVMACVGIDVKSDYESAIDVRGSYAAPPGPDWGWRIQIVVETSTRIDIRMFNISPQGIEEPAVIAIHHPQH